MLVKLFVKIYFRLYERRDLAIDYPRSRLRGLVIFHINAVKRTGLPRRASKSKLRIRTTKLSWPALFGITVHFTSSVGLSDRL